VVTDVEIWRCLLHLFRCNFWIKSMARNLDLNKAIQVKTTLKVLSPGMYTVRYIKTQLKNSDEAKLQRATNVPLAFSQAPIHMAGQIEFICPEGITHQTLSAPGDYLIANVKGGDAVLSASKYLPKPLAGKVDVQWRIEPLQQPKIPTTKAPIGHKPASGNERSSKPGAAPLPIRLSGHVERQGDVTVGAGEWLGSPTGQARLEGLKVEWQNPPHGVEFVSACRSGGKALQVRGSDYLGTKRQATPITQLALCLGGENATAYQLDAEAVFSDGSHHVLGSKEAVQASRGGHLIAVRLQVTPTGSSPASTVQTPSTQTATSSVRSSWLDPDATQITKAQP
jgi:hypothetical protein